jgi:ElaB/YqjD/DUF883 family membrane-anchored ribosome-binding protein
MQTATRENDNGVAINLAHLTAMAHQGKVFAEELVDNGKRKAQRVMKKGLEVGEDYLDDSRLYIKHNPWQSLGVALGVGLVMGFLGGFFISRRS